MPRPKTDIFWRETIKNLVANNPRMGDKAVYRELERLGKRLRRNDYPSERTIRRIREEFQELPEGERRQYQLFSWPGAMERGDVPWEASPVALGLLRYYHENGLGRPVLRLVKWYWRATVASPDAPLPKRLELAWALAAGEIIGGLPPREAESIERDLAGFGVHEAEWFRLTADRDTFIEFMLATMAVPGGLETASKIWEYLHREEGHEGPHNQEG